MEKRTLKITPFGSSRFAWMESGLPTVAAVSGSRIRTVGKRGSAPGEEDVRGGELPVGAARPGRSAEIRTIATAHPVAIPPETTAPLSFRLIAIDDRTRT